MPEGDAIFRTARTLHRALAGRTVVRFESVFPKLTRVHDDARITGRTVESVTAAGKHVLMRFSDDLTLRTHMRMNGSWHVYRPGERWRKPRRDMRILVATAEFEAVAFTVPVAEFLDSKSEARQDDLRTMGPDLLAASFDEDEALRRIRARNDEEIADVLLTQRVVAGIGNIYKCETLFLCRVSPFARAGTLPDDTIRTLLRTARKYLQANVNKRSGGIVTYAGFRRERGEGRRHYAYGRAGRPCRTCGTAIQLRAQGANARLTYWCPACQPSGA
ncbi:MAG: Fpg/Nei family DNA glycosylase [Vicinamibacterales bacterium]